MDRPRRSRSNKRTTGAIISAPLALILLAIPSLASSCDPGTKVGQIIENALAPVNQAIQQAGATGNGLLMSAGTQLQLAIDQASSAFAEALNDGINNVDATVKQSLNRISELSRQIATDSRGVLQQVADDATVLLNQIPFTNKNPQVTRYSPTFTTAEGAAQGLDLVMAGNFFKASDPDFAPTLRINGAEVSGALKANTTTRLVFRLPPGTFTPGSLLAAPNIQVQLPYERGSPFHKQVVPGTFNLFVSTLPDRPVRTVTLSTEVEGQPPVERQPFKSGETYVSSLDCAPHTVDLPFTPPAGGWTIDPLSARVQVTGGYPKGPSGTIDGPYFSQLGTTGLIVHVATRPACFWPIVEGGRTNFFVAFDVVRFGPRPKVTTVCDLSSGPPCPDLNLGWGDSKVAAVPQRPGDWKLVITLFNGRTIVGGPGINQDTPWVDIVDTGGNVKFTAESLDNLSLGMFVP
jgi:hypothetical protein